MGRGKLQIGVVGLGKFGLSFAEQLVEFGHEVLGLDHNSNRIKHAQGKLTQVFLADAREKEVLEQTGIGEFKHVMVSVGDSVSASAMITMFLKELEVKQVWVKARDFEHGKLLEKIGADRVVIPEDLAARQLADQLTHPGFVNYLPFDHNMIIQKLTIDHSAGQTLRQLDLTNRHKIQVIAVHPENGLKPTFIPHPDEVLKVGDILMVIGHRKQLDDFTL